MKKLVNISKVIRIKTKNYSQNLGALLVSLESP